MQDHLELVKETLDILSRINVPNDRPNGTTHYKPFFYAFKICREQSGSIEAINGGISHIQPLLLPKIIGDVEIRLGDYEKGGGVARGDIKLVHPLNSKAARSRIKNLVTTTFWDAVDDYESRLTALSGVRNRKQVRDKLVYFSREDPVQYCQELKPFCFDHQNMSEMAASATASLFDKRLLTVSMDMDVRNRVTVYGNSEGTSLLTCSPIYRILLRLSMEDDDGRIIEHFTPWNGSDFRMMPSLDDIIEAGEDGKRTLSETVVAPLQEKTRCPCLFDDDNSGVLFHEVVGHAKEGHRYQIGQNHDGFLGEVTTFAGKSKRVAPEFISLYDDPNDASTIGHYIFDDEGVRAERVPLIRNGAQLELLHSRQSAGYFKKHSNGHGRAELHQDPVSRMGVLILESDNKFPIEALYDKLIELVRKGRHDYGLVFQGGHRGASATEEDFYQMVPQSIIRVYPDGRKERVRGAINAGTPLETLAKIYATSDTCISSDSHCGAESGWIPVGQMMPWTLFKSLEINPLKEDEYEQFPRHVLPD